MRGRFLREPAFVVENLVMQGRGDPEAVLTDAAALCGDLVKAGSVSAWLAVHRRDLFPDDAFADLFPSGKGRPSVPADVIATVMVLQALEGLSDREAADALRLRIDWKVACGLALDDEGIHPTTLTYWRNRLRKSEWPRRIFDAVAVVIAATGVLKGKPRRALDSTIVDDAVATQDTVTQLVAAIRRVRREVPAAAVVDVTAHDYTRAGKPACAWDDPAARDALVSGLVNDAIAILDAVADEPLDAAQADAVGLLALVAGQDVEPGHTPGTWRIVRGTAKDRVISTVDPDSRHAHKSRSKQQDGYKAHIAVEPDTGLITGCALTPGNTHDGVPVTDLLADEDESVQVLADSAYGAADTRNALAETGHTAVIKPVPLNRAVPGGFSTDDFIIDTARATVTCPAGQTVTISGSGKAHFYARCDGCPLRSRCTTSTRGRTVNVHPHHDVLAAARRAAEDTTWQATYTRHRPMVERSIAWLVANGHRRVRYRGTDHNQMWLDHRVAAINLRQLIRRGLTGTAGAWQIA
jgi:IS5 family transposase